MFELQTSESSSSLHRLARSAVSWEVTSRVGGVGAKTRVRVYNLVALIDESVAVLSVEQFIARLEEVHSGGKSWRARRG